MNFVYKFRVQCCEVLIAIPIAAGFDGVDCAWKSLGAKSSYCYAIGVSEVVSTAKRVFNLPLPINLFVRTLLMTLPKRLLPNTKPYSCVAILDPDTNSLVDLLQDPRGKDLTTMTGITFYKNKLYLGSLHNDYIGVYSLN